MKHVSFLLITTIKYCLLAIQNTKAVQKNSLINFICPKVHNYR